MLARPRNLNGKSWPLLASRFLSPSSPEFQNSQPKKELQTGKIKAVVLNKLFPPREFSWPDSLSKVGMVAHGILSCCK